MKTLAELEEFRNDAYQDMDDAFLKREKATKALEQADNLHTELRQKAHKAWDAVDDAKKGGAK